MALIVPARKGAPILEFASWKTRAHIVYKVKGKRVPGASTVAKQKSAPALTNWANNLGLEGFDNQKYASEAAAVGELGHYLIECAIKGMQPDEGDKDIRDFSENQHARAAHALNAFIEWIDSFSEVETILSEQSFTSEEWMFGGTIDWLVKLNGKTTLIDFKTSKRIYGNHRIQACGYWKLLEENGYHIQSLQLVKVPREAKDPLYPEPLSGMQVKAGWQFFEYCLGMYWLCKDYPEFN